MLGSSIAPFDFSGRAVSSVRSRLVFCFAPGACELNAGDIRLTASWLRGLRHCSRVRLGPGPRSFQRLRKENLLAPAQSLCRCAADGVGAKAGTLTLLAVPRGAESRRSRLGGRQGSDVFTIRNEHGLNYTAVCFHAGIVFGSCGLSPVPLGLHPRFGLRKSPAVVRGALCGTMAGRLRRPSAVR
jgi:hypothetical protein